MKVGKEIMVKVNYEWVKCKIVEITQEQFFTYEEPLHIKVETIEGDSIIINDAFYGDFDKWKEISCKTCIHGNVEGGDFVPYGSTQVQTLEYIWCDKFIDDGETDLAEETDYGKNCKYYEFYDSKKE